MNIFNFTGNLGKDCEVKTSQNGKIYAVFSVAVKSGWGDNQKTTWVGCSIFGKKAEGALPQHLKKGTQVAISGELSMDEWTDNATGAVNKMLKVNVQNLDLIGGNPSQSAQPQAQPQAQQQQQYQQQAPQQSPPQQQAPQPNAGSGSVNNNQQFQQHAPQGNGQNNDGWGTPAQDEQKAPF